MPTFLTLTAPCTWDFGDLEQQQVEQILADGNLKGLYAASAPPTLRVGLHGDAEDGRGRLERAATRLRQVRGIREVRVDEQAPEPAGPASPVGRALRDDPSPCRPARAEGAPDD